eukprot:11656632-Prorocentrum_lima.AAC.1
MTSSLVGSEMCIRDSLLQPPEHQLRVVRAPPLWAPDPPWRDHRQHHADRQRQPNLLALGGADT